MDLAPLSPIAAGAGGTGAVPLVVPIEGGRPDADPRDRGAAWREAGVVASALGHVLVAALLLGLLAPAQPLPPEETIAVELVEPAETEPPPAEQPQEQPAAEAPEPPPPAPSASPDFTEAAEPLPPASVTVEPKSEAGAADTAGAAAAPVPQAAEAGAADLSVGEGAAPPVPAPAAGDGPGAADGSRETTLTKDELDRLFVKARSCWTIPSGWTTRREVSVTLRFRLTPEGRLAARPTVIEFHASPLGKAAADNAIKALRECAPYPLPPEKYEEWRDVEMRFAP